MVTYVELFQETIYLPACFPMWLYHWPFLPVIGRPQFPTASPTLAVLLSTPVFLSKSRPGGDGVTVIVIDSSITMINYGSIASPSCWSFIYLLWIHVN